MKPLNLLFLFFLLMQINLWAEERNEAISFDLYSASFNYWSLSYEWGFSSYFSLDTSLGYSPSLQWDSEVEAFIPRIGLRFYPMNESIFGPFIGSTIECGLFRGKPDRSGIYMSRNYSFVPVVHVFTGWKMSVFNSHWFIEPALGYYSSISGGSLYAVDKEDDGFDYTSDGEKENVSGLSFRLLSGFNF